MFSLSKKLKNDLYFATSFTFLFTAYNTQSHIQKTLTVSIQRENPTYTVDGYVCFGIIYTTASLAMWMSPAIIVIIGRKTALIFGALCYMCFVIFCYFENVFLTYVGAAITGFGAALLWTAQANYVVLNSEVGDIYQGICVFWVLYQSSYLFGNAIVYLQFHDSTKAIDRSMRGQIALFLVAFVLVAIFILSRLAPPIREEEDEKEIRNPLGEIKKAFSITTSKTGLTLCILFMYIGVHLTFLSILGASLGFSQYLSENSREFAPLSGFIQGFGEIAGSMMALYFKRITLWKLKPVLTIGGLGSVLAYVIIFLGLPDSSVFNYTENLPIVKLPAASLLFTNFLIGMGDACSHIEIYQYLGTVYPHDSAPAFASFKFLRSLATAISFYYSNLIGLHTQLLVLTVLSILGYLTYHYDVLTRSSKAQINTKESSELQQKSSTAAHTQPQENDLYQSYQNK